MTHLVGVAAWCVTIWLLLIGMVSFEVLLVGASVALAVAAILSPLRTIAPWRLFAPRRLIPLALLIADTLWRIVRANLTLTRIVLSSHPRLATGTIVVPTRMRGDGQLAGVAIITSLIVDNQIIDLDRSRHELLYHCIGMPPGDHYEAINGPVERRLLALSRQ